MNENLRNTPLQVSKATPSNRPAAEECRRLFRLAQDEASVNRADLERLYERGTLLLDELRYEYLWNLAQLERTCSELERAAQNALRESQSHREMRDRVSRLMLRAVELRQQARSILNGEQHRAENRATHLHAEGRRPGNSSQRQPALA